MMVIETLNQILRASDEVDRGETVVEAADAGRSGARRWRERSSSLTSSRPPASPA